MDTAARQRKPRRLHDAPAIGTIAAMTTRVTSSLVRTAAVVALWALAVPLPFARADLPRGFADRLVVGGLDRPCGIAFLPDGRLLVVEQLTAKVRLIVDGALSSADPVGTVADVNVTGGERGLLGIAVDPAWPIAPYVYVLSTSSAPPSSIRISRFTVTGDLSFTGGGELALDPASRYELIDDVPDANSIHNGGTLRFGPDGMLYASLGEDNVPCAAQDSTVLGGVILRLDVSRLPAMGGGAASRDLVTPPDNPFVSAASPNARLVWVQGLRNPFRFHFDPGSGELFVADVGRNRYEEIDRATSGGLDFGWPIFEGTVPFSNACAPSTTPTAPIIVLDRQGRADAAIISAGFCRLPPRGEHAFPPEYEGDYFFADYYDGGLRRWRGAGDTWTPAAPVAGQPTASLWGTGFAHVSDWVFGPAGGLWYCKQDIAFAASTGQVRVIVPAPADTGEVGAMLAMPYPSPSSGTVTLGYSIPRAALVELSLHDVRGRLVRRLEPPQTMSAGSYVARWDGRDDRGGLAPSGLYFARLRVDGRSFERRVPLVR